MWILVEYPSGELRCSGGSGIWVNNMAALKASYRRQGCRVVAIYRRRATWTA